jgi:uncharacterized protein
MDLFDQVREEVKRLFAGARGSHDWEHTQRVVNLCLHLGKKEKADLEVLKLAALLHDVGREHQDRASGKICHAERGAVMARELLSRYHVDVALIEKVVHCIETHRFRGGQVPHSLEARVLFDADKLDAIGATGIGRAFLFAGEVGAKLHDKGIVLEETVPYSNEDTAYREFLVKLVKLKDRMLTGEGKLLAQARHQFMVDFFDRLNREVDGEL